MLDKLNSDVAIRWRSKHYANAVHQEKMKKEYYAAQNIWWRNTMTQKLDETRYTVAER